MTVAVRLFGIKLIIYDLDLLYLSCELEMSRLVRKMVVPSTNIQTLCYYPVTSNPFLSKLRQIALATGSNARVNKMGKRAALVYTSGNCES